MAKPSPQEPILAKYYQNIDSLPLSRFIDCICDQNLFALVITGKPSEIELKEAFDKIGEQYAAASGDSHSIMIFLLQKEIKMLQFDYNEALFLIKTLGEMRLLSDHEEYKEMAKALNSILRTRFLFSHKNKDLDKHLRSCTTRLSSIKINIEFKSASFNKLEASREKGKKIDRGYFTSVLISLSNHAKYQIPESITVLEFCKRILQMNDYYKKR